LAPAPSINFWDQPAFAVIVTGVVAIIVLIVNSIINTRMHQEKLSADRDLAREKFEFDKIADERRAAIERSLDQWRRRVAFAESELTAFYEARSHLSAIRSPASFSGEGEAREGREKEDAELQSQRDIYYPVLKRIQDNADFFNAFYSKRYLAIALLGPGADVPYRTMWQALVRVHVSVGMLLRRDAFSQNPQAIAFRQKMEEVIWEGASENDTQALAVEQAVIEAEAIFRPVIQPPPG